MKSFLSFISEAKAKKLPTSTKAGEFTIAQWTTKYNKALKVYNAARNKATIAQAERIGKLWYKTWYDAWYFGLNDDINNGKVRPSTVKKLVSAEQTWAAKSEVMIAELEAERKAFAARWANEKDPCKKMFRDKLFFAIHDDEKERDTPKEEDIWQRVYDYVSHPDSSRGHDKTAYAELLRCKATYKQQLDPAVKTLYRGINIPLKAAFKLIDFKKLKQTTTIAGVPMMGHETKYKPLHPVESWSSRTSIALGFASVGSGQYGGDSMSEIIGFSLVDLKSDLASLKRYIARKQKLKSLPKDKRKEDYKDDVAVVDSGIRYTIQDNINTYLASDKAVPVVYQITPDKYCVMNPLFSNKIGDVAGVGSEFEVTRIESTPVAATVWIPKAIIDAAIMIAEMQELIKQEGIKTPQIKVAVPVTLKKGK